ncbi:MULTISPECIES: HAD family hydrolase [unclassified Crossiella]|uniref:HAD-IIIC family phosphatase n=1 Tax=unclassified Crossiella TaxID=2620835 RepID=UPI001FFE4645|nr:MULTISPECIES: HAD-IIIC family phosphatase [unclassified Crossiella]MCK2241385.1 HAD-IIIC family phosphatase [Crossiella sp. S99.2]MCK2253471.1 HAD-IIIC family phosphatase [Crossiella sp. S99.1]
MSVKCVVWDLDGTLWDGIAVEQTTETLPAPRPAVLALIDELAARGVMSSIASRTDPSILGLLLADELLAERFVAPQADWQDKSVALRRISAELGIGLAALAFVDDNPFERAEVAAALPEVLVLAPEQAAGLLDSPELDPAALTPEARGRVRRYREDARRKDAETAFTGSRAEFLRWCGMRLTLRPATAADVPRLVELARRTHRMNTTGEVPPVEDVLARLTDPDGWFLPVAELSDRFGGYGLIGAAVIEQDAAVWRVRLLALSCRVAGRGVAPAFLRWVMDRALAEGARELHVPVRPTGANVELRVLFRQCGLRVTGPQPADLAILGRRLDQGGLPDYPEYLELETQA